MLAALIALSSLAAQQSCGADAVASANELRVMNYNVNPIPRHKQGAPIVVFVGLYIESMSSMSVQEMSFILDMYLRLSWTDEQLRAGNGTTPAVDHRPRTVNEVWSPDIYFVNAKRAMFHAVIQPNMAFWVDDSDGTVAYSSRISAEVACPLNLAHYPMDGQSCALRMMSYAHAEQVLELRWFDNGAISKADNIKLAEFVLEDMVQATCNATYEYGKTQGGSRFADFSCLEVRFDFQRQITYHVVQTYVPSAAIVAISWVSFWIDPNAVPARVSLSFTTLLTLTTMGTGIRFSLPAVSYAKAIDHWFFTCMFFVFAALLQFATVNSYIRRAHACDKKAELVYARQATAAGGGGGHKNGVAAAPLEHLSASMIQDAGDCHRRRAAMTDRICRLAFPLAFVTFNVFYWMYFGGFL